MHAFAHHLRSFVREESLRTKPLGEAKLNWVG